MVTLPEDKKLAEVEQQLEEEVKKLEEKVKVMLHCCRFVVVVSTSHISSRPACSPSSKTRR